MVRLVATDGRRELRHLVADWLSADVAHLVTGLELVADAVVAAPVLWASEPWIEASVDGGAFVAVGTDQASGAPLGGFLAGERKSLTLRVTVPAGSPRRRLIDLPIGLGI